jgi:hypothetical protein
VHGICSLETSEIVDDNEKLIVMTVERVLIAAFSCGLPLLS